MLSNISTRFASSRFARTVFQALTAGSRTRRQSAAPLQAEIQSLECRQLLTQIVLAETDGDTVVTEAGHSDVINVSLSSQPASPVVLNVESHDIGEVSVSPATLIFDADNWDQPQVITVAGQADNEIADGDVTALIGISVDDERSDPAFTATPNRSVPVINRSHIAHQQFTLNGVGRATDVVRVASLTGNTALDAELRSTDGRLLAPVVNGTVSFAGLHAGSYEVWLNDELANVQFSVSPNFGKSTGSPFSHAFDIDGSGDFQFSTDGIVLLAYTFGSRGESLAEFSGTDRPAAEIEGAISQLADALDVDGDGEFKFANDGITLLAHSFGTRGEALGAFRSPEATRSADEITSRLEGLAEHEDDDIAVWTGNTGNWEDPINWRSRQVPDENDLVVFTGTGQYEVTLNSPKTIRALELGDGIGNSSLVLRHELNVSSNTVVRDGSTLTLINAQLSGDVDNGGTVVVHRHSAITGSFDNDATGELILQGNHMGGSTLIIDTADGAEPSVLSNQGLIRLETVTQNGGDQSATLWAAPGVVIQNESAGLIHSVKSVGNENRNTIRGNVINEGTIRVDDEFRLDVDSAGVDIPPHVIQRDGAIDAAGVFVVNSGKFDYVGGRLVTRGDSPLDGGVFANDSEIFVAASVTSTSTLHAAGSSFLLGNLSPTTTISISQTSSFGNATLVTQTTDANNGTISNFGTLRLLNLIGTGAGQPVAQLVAREGETFVNEASGHIHSAEKHDGGHRISGHFVNRGSMNVDEKRMEFRGRLTVDGGTFHDLFFVWHSEIEVTASPSEPITISLIEEHNRLISDNLPNVTLWVRGGNGPASRPAALTVARDSRDSSDDPVTHINNGTIRLETVVERTGSQAVSLRFDDAQFVNGPHGTLHVPASDGGSHDRVQFLGPLMNHGLVDVGHPIEFGRPDSDDAHMNSRSIRTSGGAKLTFYGAALTNFGSLLRNVGTPGVIEGTGTIDVTGLTGEQIAHQGQLTNFGTIRPGGDEIGTLTILGNLVLGSTSQLGIQLGGPATVASSPFDQLLVSTEAQLAGIVIISLVNGYIPQASEQFIVFDSLVSQNGFDQFLLPALQDGLEMLVGQPHHPDHTLSLHLS